MVAAPRREIDSASPPNSARIGAATADDLVDGPGGSPNGNGTGNGHAGNGNAALGPAGAALPARAPGCTAPQLRRFIKSRTYVPMHELRRRFGIDGTEDDVSPVHADGHRIFVGLPPREGRLLEELLRGGDVGYELSMDPLTPIVIGLYPMRPVPRG
jgi:hypothetical protein